MVSFSEYQDFIKTIVKSNELNEIVSIYSYGSIAQGNFEKNYSDADLWFVITCNSVRERIDIVNKVSRVFNDEIKKYLDRIHKTAKNKKYQYHSNLVFTENEFRKYCNSYPTRVIYPIKMNVWKLVYGEDLLEGVELPDRETCIRYLQYDFEVFAQEFDKLSFSDNTRDMLKYFLRAMKKAIWILKDEYLSCKDEVLESADKILSGDQLLVSVISRIQQAKKIDYNVPESDYLDLFLDCSKLLRNYGREIKNYIINNGYMLISCSPPAFLAVN